MESFEYMRLTGWGDHFWAAIPPAMKSIEYAELAANLAATSFSMYDHLPWALSLLATYGEYRMEEAAFIAPFVAPGTVEVASSAEGGLSDDEMSSEEV